MAPQRGDIYFVDLDPTAGREQSGVRPVVVLSVDAINRLPLVVTVVAGTRGTRVDRDYTTNVRVAPEDSGLPYETVFLGFQIRSIDPIRMAGPPAGRLADTAMARLEQVVRRCLGL